MLRHPDWNCPECGHLNFGKRDECEKCRCYRSKAFKNRPLIKKGDWNCECGELNFASRNACRKCGKNKIGIFNNSLIEKKPGDWDCSCATVNFGSRTVCFKCGKDKLQTDAKVPERETCIICMEREIDTVLTPCGHLGYCGLCAFNMTNCPVCRQLYNPDTDLLKVFKVV